MGFNVRSFGEVVALAECVDHAGRDGAGVIAKKLPERAGVTNGRLKPDVCGLRARGGQHCGIKALGGTEGRALGSIVEDTGRRVSAFLEKDLVDVPPTVGFTGKGVDFSMPASVVILTFVDDQGIEARPSLPESWIPGDFEDDAGKLDFIKCANGIRGAACRWQAGWLSRERTEFEEKFLPTADDDLAAFDLAEGDDAPELGGERLVVSEEKHALAVALAGMAEGEFEGVPGFTGPGAAVDEELAILRKLVKQGESLPSRHDLAIFLLSRHYLAIITP
jgi:hypothetical protein